MKRVFFLSLFLLWSAIATALPTSEAVQAEVKAGHYAQAESMMHEVVAAKPKSAKAHYVYAEILAHNGRFDQAAREAQQAREIDPAIGFTDVAKFRDFEQLMQREQQAQRASSNVAPRATAVAPAPAYREAPRSNGLPGWVWGLGGAAIAVLIWRLIAARSAASAPAAGYPAGTAYGGGYGGGVPVQPSGGSGLLGTGLAAAGGFAAGMLAEKMLEGDHGREVVREVDRGGLQPGMFDDAPNAAAKELESRSIDFGSGGDWGADGSADFGGGDGGGDW